jgi:hypothetical protein
MRRFNSQCCQVWEVQTGRCLKTWNVGGVVKSVAWCPNSALSLVAVAVDTKVCKYLYSRPYFYLVTAEIGTFSF